MINIVLALIGLLGGLTSYQSGNLPQTTLPPYLSDTTRWISDSTDYASFRLKVINPSDSLVVIERVQPSCGCILTTIQRNLATKEAPGDIYVAVTTHKLDSLQPITIDVYTNKNRTVPMRAYLRRAYSAKPTEQKEKTPSIPKKE